MVRRFLVPVVAALAIAFMLSAPRPAEARLGLRAGMSLSPDQFVGGFHFALSPIGNNLYIVPSAEAGFGDDLFTLCGNGDLQYRFKSSGGPQWYVGGGVSLFYVDPDGGDSDTNVGVSALGGVRLSKIFLEAKAGFGDMPEWKFMVGFGK